MKVEQVFSDRKRFLDLLLLADEQEDMIDRYLERGDMFALYDEDKLRAVCVVTNEDITNQTLSLPVLVAHVSDLVNA